MRMPKSNPEILHPTSLGVDSSQLTKSTLACNSLPLPLSIFSFPPLLRGKKDSSTEAETLVGSVLDLLIPGTPTGAPTITSVQRECSNTGGYKGAVIHCRSRCDDHMLRFPYCLSRSIHLPLHDRSTGDDERRALQGSSEPRPHEGPQRSPLGILRVSHENRIGIPCQSNVAPQGLQVQPSQYRKRESDTQEAKKKIAKDREAILMLVSCESHAISKRHAREASILNSWYDTIPIVEGERPQRSQAILMRIPIDPQAASTRSEHAHHPPCRGGHGSERGR